MRIGPPGIHVEGIYNTLQPERMSESSLHLQFWIRSLFFPHFSGGSDPNAASFEPASTCLKKKKKNHRIRFCSRKREEGQRLQPRPLCFSLAPPCRSVKHFVTSLCKKSALWGKRWQTERGQKRATGGTNESSNGVSCGLCSEQQEDTRGGSFSFQSAVPPLLLLQRWANDWTWIQLW